MIDNTNKTKTKEIAVVKKEEEKKEVKKATSPGMKSVKKWLAVQILILYFKKPYQDGTKWN